MKKYDVYGEIIGRNGELMLRMTDGEIYSLDINDPNSILPTILTVVAQRLLKDEDYPGTPSLELLDSENLRLAISSIGTKKL